MPCEIKKISLLAVAILFLLAFYLILDAPRTLYSEALKGASYPSGYSLAQKGVEELSESQPFLRIRDPVPF
jgi:hypothetical protein